MPGSQQTASSIQQSTFPDGVRATTKEEPQTRVACRTCSGGPALRPLLSHELIHCTSAHIAPLVCLAGLGDIPGQVATPPFGQTLSDDLNQELLVIWRQGFHRSHCVLKASG